MKYVNLLSYTQSGQTLSNTQEEKTSGVKTAVFVEGIRKHFVSCKLLEARKPFAFFMMFP